MSSGSLATGHRHGGRGWQRQPSDPTLAKIPRRQWTLRLDQIPPEFLEGSFPWTSKFLREAAGGRLLLRVPDTRRRRIGAGQSGADGFGSGPVSIRELFGSGRVV